MKSLMEQMEWDLWDCMQDEYGPHRPEFFQSTNLSAGENYSVTTKWSRDPSRANNGGEYYEDRRYFVGPNGSVHSYSRSLPSRERGLKQWVVDYQVKEAMSLPSRERGLKRLNFFNRNRLNMSLPSRERGLKPV